MSITFISHAGACRWFNCPRAISLPTLIYVPQVPVCPQVLPEQGRRGWAPLRHQDLPQVHDLPVPRQIKELLLVGRTLKRPRRWTWGESQPGSQKNNFLCFNVKSGWSNQSPNNNNNKVVYSCIFLTLAPVVELWRHFVCSFEIVRRVLVREREK